MGLRGSRRTALVPLSALAVALIALLHSSIDFSLQVSGYAIVVFALVGVALGFVFGDEASDTPVSRRRRRRPDSEHENVGVGWVRDIVADNSAADSSAPPDRHHRR
jgi:hypothetical protein